LQFEAPLSAGNVMLVCPKCGEITRVGYHRDEDGGGAARICRKCKAEVDG
jgi:large subunit ribosomal protein L24